MVIISGLCFVGPSMMIMAGRHAHVYKKLESIRPVEVNDRLLLVYLLLRRSSVHLEMQPQLSALPILHIADKII